MAFLTLVIPCFNEADNLPALIRKCEKAFENEDVEVILVNNGSNDNSERIMRKQIRLKEKIKFLTLEKNNGYGEGILSGLKQSNSKFIGWSHADLQTNPSDCLLAEDNLEKLDKECFYKGKRYGRRFSDLIFTFGMTLFESMVLRKVLWDINAQPNLMSKEFFNSLEDPPKDFSFDLYAYYFAKKSGLKIKRFPVHFRKRLAGEAHLSNFFDKIKYSYRTLVFSVKLMIKLSLKKNKFNV